MLRLIGLVKVHVPLVLRLLIIPAIMFSSALAHAETKPLRIGFTAVVIEQSINLNLKVAKYLGSKLNEPVETIYRKSYREINEMLGRSELDIAFICGYAYVAGKDEFGLELLASPSMNGRPFYRSYVIVPSVSEDKDFYDLRGKSYAFTDPLSNSGYLVPVFWLSQRGEGPDTFFKKYIYTKGHYNSIEAVAMRIVDGASVDSYVWEHAKGINPVLVSKTKVIKESAQYPFPPVVARKDLNKGIKERIRKVLLAMNDDPIGRGIMKDIGFDGFVAIRDDFYEPIREMERKVMEGKRR